MVILDKNELAAYLKVEIKTIKNLVYRNKIPKVKVGKEYRFIKEDIDAWLRESREFPKRYKFKVN